MLLSSFPFLNGNPRQSATHSFIPDLAPEPLFISVIFFSPLSVCIHISLYSAGNIYLFCFDLNIHCELINSLSDQVNKAQATVNVYNRWTHSSVWSGHLNPFRSDYIKWWSAASNQISVRSGTVVVMTSYVTLS